MNGRFIKRGLARMADRLRQGGLAPEQWVDTLSPWMPFLLLLLVLPLLLTGPIRTLTSLPLPWSLALALVIYAVVVRALWPWLRGCASWVRSPRMWVCEGVAMIPVGLAIWALYVRAFSGFPNLDGWDGGSHVLIKDQFAAFAPTIYNGQVAYHAFVWWLETLLRIDSFHSFAAAFYVTVAVTVALPVAIAFAVVRAEAAQSRLALGAGMSATVLGTVGALWLVVLPLLHYNQGAGYYVHVFGLLPLMLLWAADALIRHQSLRVAALLSGFVLLRYTYSLNLADAALAVACVLLVEGFRGRWRIMQLLVVAALVVAARHIVHALRPIFLVWGGMQRFDVDQLRGADLRIIVAGTIYLLLSAWQTPGRASSRSPMSRALAFPLCFGLASSVLVSIFRQGKSVQYYYVTKYQMWAAVLLAFVVVILVAHVTALVMNRTWLRRPSVWLRLLVVVVLLDKAPAMVEPIFAGYRTSMMERVRPHGPTYKHLLALADVGAVARIKRILAAEHKQFGGYLTAFFPRFSFMNAMLGYHSGRQEFFPPVTRPGFCVFWVTKERDIHRLGRAHHLDVLRSQVATPGSTCVEYDVPWKSSRQSLCYRCY
jgi:hypothetical protein